MSWYYWKFPGNSVAEEMFLIIGRNNIIFYYHYKVYPNIGKGNCSIHHIPCSCPACVAQLDKYWLPNCASSYQPSYVCVENGYYNKILEH